MKKERPQPYIGFSGLVNPYQQGYLIGQFDRSGLQEMPYRRQTALGVKATHKPQFTDTENKYGREWYPVGAEEFANALAGGDTEGLRVAQVYFDAEHVQDERYRDEFVERIRRRGEAWLNAIQFDLLPWHTDDSLLPWLEKLKEESGLTILLQAHGEAMKQLGPEGVVRKLGQFANHAFDYVLYDSSHGKGERLNVDKLEPFLYAGNSSAELEEIGFGVAGGLNAEVVSQDLPDLLDKYRGTSVDAEGQLHTARPDGTRPLDLYQSTLYLDASADVLREIYRFKGYN